MERAAEVDAPTASTDRRGAVGLLVLAGWAMSVPWLGRAVGLELDVSTRLEIIDHVVPGAAVLACAVLLLHPRAAGAPGGPRRLGLTGLASLAGLWMTATHWVLVDEAIDGVSPWGAALLHLSTGPPITVLALWMLLVGAAR